ncbi:calcium-binding protein [candidate division WWE3 bacterium]|uniref:Calcium-binding protein n=1 Tax=candidate division WWE3 bacterium TaxID=2053526 RepID=A0A3A4ZCQ0_UNCKA|nr:MAG: calcium-binding protein [candidate division WWE3 bacterium]
MRHLRGECNCNCAGCDLGYHCNRESRGCNINR